MKKIMLIILMLSSTVYAKDIKPEIYSVVDLNSGQYLEQNKSNKVHSIASLTKLMTAYVLIKYHPNLDTCFTKITQEDKDLLKNTTSKIAKDQYISCKKLTQAMLILSDNWAASALSKALPGVSSSQFIGLMNHQAQQWNMKSTYFKDSSGLSPQNMSTAEDLNSLIWNIVQVQQISQLSTQKDLLFVKENGELNFYKNTNKLIREDFAAKLSKTGYIRESGYNLVFVPEKCLKRKIAIVIMGAKSSANRADFAEKLINKYGCF